MSRTRSNDLLFGTSRQATHAETRGAPIAGPTCAAVSSSSDTGSVRLTSSCSVPTAGNTRSLPDTARLDAEQHAALHLVGAVIQTMSLLRARRDRAAARCRSLLSPAIVQLWRIIFRAQGVSHKSDGCQQRTTRARPATRRRRPCESTACSRASARAPRAGWYFASVVAVPHLTDERLVGDRGPTFTILRTVRKRFQGCRRRLGISRRGRCAATKAPDRATPAFRPLDTRPRPPLSIGSPGVANRLGRTRDGSSDYDENLCLKKSGRHAGACTLPAAQQQLFVGAASRCEVTKPPDPST